MKLRFFLLALNNYAKKYGLTSARLGACISNLNSEIENLKSLFAQTPEMFCITSGALHTFEYVNHAHIKALGFDATGMDVRVAQPESVEVHGILDNVYNTGETAALHEIAVTLGTSLRYFDLTYAAKRDSQGKINGIMILGNEVTDRVLIEQKIKFERQRMYTFFEKIPAAISVLRTPDFRFEVANQSYINLLGANRNVIGQTLYEVIPDLSPEFADILSGVVESKKPFNAYEFPVEIDWDGSGEKHTKYLNFFYEPLINSSNEVEAVLAFVYDITEQVEAKDRVTKALKVRDEFLSIASHELKTPLTSLNLQIQSSQRRIAKGNFEEVSTGNIPTLFHKYKKQTDRLIRLVDDMLDLSKINLGKLSFDFKRTELSSIIDVSYENLKEHYDNNGINIRLVKPTHGIYGMFDQQRIEQVLTNLLMNALKYGEGKPVIVELSSKDNMAEIKVIDQGMGVPLENADNIFKKFERVPATLDISGLGIGLYITKEIVDAHNGRVWVESQPGTGSTFIVQLPIES